MNTGLPFKEALEQAGEGGYQNELNEIAPEMDIVKSPISSLKGGTYVYAILPFLVYSLRACEQASQSVNQPCGSRRSYCH